MIPTGLDFLVLRPTRPEIVGAAPTPTDPGYAVVIVDIGEKDIGTFKIGEGTYDYFLDPVEVDRL